MLVSGRKILAMSGAFQSSINKCLTQTAACSISLLLSYLRNLDRKLWFALTLGSSFLSSKEACLLLSYTIFLLGKRHFGTVPPLLFNFFLRLLLIHWILSYCSMSFLIHLLHHVWSYVVLYVLRELFLVSIFIFFNQVTPVVFLKITLVKSFVFFF